MRGESCRSECFLKIWLVRLSWQWWKLQRDVTPNRYLSPPHTWLFYLPAAIVSRRLTRVATMHTCCLEPRCRIVSSSGGPFFCDWPSGQSAAAHPSLRRYRKWFTWVTFCSGRFFGVAVWSEAFGVTLAAASLLGVTSVSQSRHHSACR